MRITKAEVYGMYRRFLKVMGAREAVNYNDVGAFNLEYNSVYGGYKIEQITNERGAISHPFYSKRLPAREMYESLYFAIQALEHVTLYNNLNLSNLACGE